MMDIILIISTGEAIWWWAASI